MFNRPPAHGNPDSPKYVSYFFQSDDFRTQKKPRLTGTKVRRISGEALSKIRIPVPPLVVQQEIGAVLDRFSKLERELKQQIEAELEARRIQYRHYRDTLLSFVEQTDSQASKQASKQAIGITRLGDIATFRRGTAITGKQTLAGDIPVVANGPVPVYHHAHANRQGETIVVARSGANAGNVSYWNKPIFLTDAFSVHPDPETMMPKFAFYLLRQRQDVIRDLKKGSGVPHVQVKAMDALEMPVPPLDEQARIVGILDKLDALVNDLSDGLPAEINARRQQYQHYRDRLLTFKMAA